MRCSRDGYKIDVQLDKASVSKVTGKNYREGRAAIDFSGPDVPTVTRQTFKYSGDDWGITVDIPGPNRADYSQLVFMFKSGGGEIRGVSLIRQSLVDGRKILQLTCQQ